jgi:predicted nucleic acid-binding protein
MMMTLDASVAVKWIATEPGSERARHFIPAIQNESQNTDLIAPATLLMEVHHALSKQFSKRLVSFEQLVTASTYIRLFCEILPVNAELVNDSSMLSFLADPQIEGKILETDLSIFAARRQPQYKPFSIYDCAYVALARDTKSTLLTADRKQADVAKAFGVPVEFVSTE